LGKSSIYGERFELRVVVVVPRRYLDYLDEELALVKTVYESIVDYIVAGGSNPRTYLSRDKLIKVRGLDFDKLVVLDRLKPSQFVNIAREIKRDVVDRILLILEIFASHAGSREALLQVELARLKHMLPLVKEAIRYAKLGELHGFLGAGRYGYEKYYTMLKRREARIRREIEKLRETRSIRRKARVEAGFPHVAIVGYTCAGKTSLFNLLTGLSKPVGPEPFTTITPKSYRVVYRDLGFIVTDTVGFIRDIPPEIIDSFYATLEEAAEADVIIDIVDASKRVSDVLREIETSREVLWKIGVYNKPVIYALNKIDRVDSVDSVVYSIVKHTGISEGDIVPISCLKRVNIDKLLEKIYSVLKNTGV
jgi:GTP-binding protein HflX